MPNIGNYSILPRFPAEAAEKGLDPLLPKGERGWYLRWVAQLLGADALVDDDFFKDLLKLMMEALKQVQLIQELETQKGHKAWALNPEQLAIYSDLAAIRLQYVPATDSDSDNSSDRETFGCWFVPQAWGDALKGLPALGQVGRNGGQPPSYQIDLSPRQSFYHDFYRHGEIKRVLAHEHTALLERRYRENLEERFIRGTQPWDTNLLSATPTLEMGIDIGDLSSVLLCSVPPSQANYLQRAGRGGRKDGNSFVLTLANGNPHDLYFYADPLRMLTGEVEAPAIFLNASMVLKRQLLAYCFDQWGMEASGEQVIPGSMQPVLDAVENRDLKKFPYTLIDYIRLNH